MKFYIRKKTGNSVRVYYNLNLSQKEKIRGTTNEKINPKWIKKDGVIPSIVDLHFPGTPITRANQVIKIRDTLLQFDKDVNIELKRVREEGVSNVKNSIKNYIDAYLGKIDKTAENDKMDLFGFIDFYIDVKKDKVGKRTIQDYELLKLMLLDYQKRYKVRLDFDRIDIKFRNRFKTYLEDTRGLSTNTVWKHFKNLKVFLNQSHHLGHHNNTIYKSELFSVKTKKTDHIYLNSDKIRKLAQYPVTDTKLKAARDYFLLMCYTGLRVGDMLRLRKSNLTVFEGVPMIDYEVEKVKGSVEDNKTAFRITKEMQQILDEWNGTFPNEVLKSKVNDTFINKAIKEISKDCGIDKYPRITNHTARRSYATNEYLNGTPIEFIRIQLFHTKPEQTIRYLRASGKEVILKMAKK